MKYDEEWTPSARELAEFNRMEAIEAEKRRNRFDAIVTVRA